MAPIFTNEVELPLYRNVSTWSYRSASALRQYANLEGAPTAISLSYTVPVNGTVSTDVCPGDVGLSATIVRKLPDLL